MRGPVNPVTARDVKEIEESAIRSRTKALVSWDRYVDDIFAVMKKNAV